MAERVVEEDTETPASGKDRITFSNWFRPLNPAIFWDVKRTRDSLGGNQMIIIIILIIILSHR